VGPVSILGISLDEAGRYYLLVLALGITVLADGVPMIFQGDAEGYGRCFTADCDYVSYDGTRAHGREPMVDSHDALFRGVLAGRERRHHEARVVLGIAARVTRAACTWSCAGSSSTT
jgi:hypothetical protein